MADLELTRSRDERRLYLLDGVGTLRLGLLGSSAAAEADGRRWRIGRTGLWRRAVRATDEAGSVAGQFEPNTLRRGGKLQWDRRELTLRPASSWRERYALADGDRELAILDGKSWGKRPVKITIDEPQALDPGLLLFAAFVVRGLAHDATDTTAAASSTAATSG
jgi:hypothetical protein